MGQPGPWRTLLLNSPSPRVYYSIQVTAHAHKDVQCVYYICDPTPRGATVAIGMPQSGLARERGGPTRHRSTSAGGEGGEGREGGETSGTSVDPGAVKAGRPRSFSGADPGRAASQDRSGRVWGNGEGERGERYSSRNVRRHGRCQG